MQKDIYKQTSEHRRRISEARMGHPVSAETRKKVGDGNRGKILSEETKRKIGLASRGNKHNLGRKLTEEHKRKIGEAIQGEKHHAFGKKFSEEHKRKLRENHKGNSGKTQSSEAREKISAAQRGKTRPTKGERNGNWNGGTSFDPYPVDWNKTLRRAIRERDHYICRECTQYGNEVHHINYDKNDCNPKNLINLCHPCHGKTGKNRDYWMNHFYIETEQY